MLNLTPEQIAALKKLPRFNKGDVKSIQEYFGGDYAVTTLATPVEVTTNGVLATHLDAYIRPLSGATLMVEGIISSTNNVPRFILIPDPEDNGHRTLGFTTLQCESQNLLVSLLA